MRKNDEDLVREAKNGDKEKMMQILEENRRTNMEYSKKICT